MKRFGGFHPLQAAFTTRAAGGVPLVRLRTPPVPGREGPAAAEGSSPGTLQTAWAPQALCEDGGGQWFRRVPLYAFIDDS